MTTPRITTEHVQEIENGKFVAEASTLGLAPGEWPSVLFTDLGNGRLFEIRDYTRDVDGDVQFVQYRQRYGCITLTVLND